MKKTFYTALLASSAVALAACGAMQPEPQEQAEEQGLDVPDWVMSPQVEDGLATSACVPSTGRFNTDQSRADMDARQQLAAGLSAQMQSLSEDYQSTIDGDDGAVQQGGMFEEVSRQVVEEQVRGSFRVTADYVDLPDGDGEDVTHFCSMMALGQDSVNQIVDQVAERVEPEEEDVFTDAELRERFLSQEALNRMDEALE
ncbi:hypothetical protein [Halorhodospira halophila]|uniref:LPP20 lipoprotein n=1 Tax=Halorhodospira halophila (strain DSM 244 / SL1) TaxID=349124 RepID=A1WTS7_HALHL|nr:hypothetical protein [Halorhodospira halophila]ABM61089.1 hypothetical protein Hhal_0295 [Halorhodospira halophila SL1]MBK1729806.1 hypothetical protein [Halorhodospira halophila]